MHGPSAAGTFPKAGSSFKRCLSGLVWALTSFKGFLQVLFIVMLKRLTKRSGKCEKVEELIVPGVTSAKGIAERRRTAICHWRLFSQALMAALKLISS